MALERATIRLSRDASKTPSQNAMPRSLQSPFAVIGPSQWAKRGYSSDSLRYPEKPSATGALLYLSRDRGSNLQISSEPEGLVHHQGMAQKIRVPFSRIFPFFLQFWGLEGDFKTRAHHRYAPNWGWNAFRPISPWTPSAERTSQRSAALLVTVWEHLSEPWRKEYTPPPWRASKKAMVGGASHLPITSFGGLFWVFRDV